MRASPIWPRHYTRIRHNHSHNHSHSHNQNNNVNLFLLIEVSFFIRRHLTILIAKKLVTGISFEALQTLIEYTKF